MLSRRHLIFGSLAGSLAGPPDIRAEAFTIDKTARLIVGFPPGGPIDTVARLLADQMKDYAPSMIVDNHPGAGGRLALQALKAAAADGSVLGLTPGDQLGLFPHVYKTLGYDPLRDFKPVTTVCTAPFAFVVGPTVPAGVTTLAAFVDWCKANPQLATFGSSGAGTLPHFLGASFARQAGFKFVHAPYKGGTPAVQDLLAGQLPAGVFTLALVLAYVQQGTLRVLATTAPTRSTVLPAVPTVREAGYPALEALIWFGLFVPAATPDLIIEALNASVRRALESGAVKTGLARQSLDAASSSPAELASLLKTDTQRWGELVRNAGFTPQ